MDLILQNSFNLNFNTINELLKKHDAVIAGGLPSFVYSNTKDNVHSYTGDIDIWIPLVGLSPELKSQCSKEISNEYIQALKPFHYNVTNRFDFSKKWCTTNANDKEKSYRNINKTKNKTTSNISDICYMVKLYNTTIQKEIQLIFTNVTTNDVISHFDISSCMVKWDGNAMHCNEPTLTQSCIGYVVNTHDATDARRIKYAERGYKIFDTEIEAYTYCLELAMNSLSLK
jgi:hypothetical protein